MLQGNPTGKCTDSWVAILGTNTVHCCEQIWAWSAPLFFFWFVFWWYGVWTQDLTLARQALYHFESLCQPCFCNGFFSGWGLANYLSSWITILLISTSWVARITDVSDWCLVASPSLWTLELGDACPEEVVTKGGRSGNHAI
jgi:hypothetical protein